MIGNGFRSMVRSASAVFRGKPKARDVLRLDNGLQLKVWDVRRGGMGTVYICAIDDTKKRESQLALKTFDDRYFFDPAMRQAFETEARSWLVVSDAPFVFPLISIVSAEKKPFLMMGAVTPNAQGDTTLADEIRRNPAGLSVSRCVLVASQIATALVECERRLPGLTHGDIKPSNILIVGNTPMLADFGAARLAAQADGGRVQSVKGTAAYLAPECWHEEHWDGAADVYALGIMMFEMLVGAPPFIALNDDLGELSRMHREDTAVFKGIAESPLEAKLRALIIDCLAKEPAARPFPANKLLGRLFRLAEDHDPVTAVEMAAVWTHFSEPELPELKASRVESLLERGDGEGALAILDRISAEELTGKLLRLKGTASSLSGRDEDAIAIFGRVLETETDPEERANASNEIGLSLNRLGLFDEAKTIFEAAIPECPRGLQMMLKSNYASTLMQSGKPDRALDILRELSQRNENSSKVWAMRAQSAWAAGQVEEAIQSTGLAINLEPSDGLLRVMLAKYLMEGRLDVAGADSALEIAFGLGHQSPEWASRTLACALLLGKNEQAAELMNAISSALTEEQADELARDAMGLVKSVIEKAGLSKGVGEAETEAKDQATVHDEPVPADDQHPTASEAPSATKDEEAFRAAIRNGSQVYLQVRTSYADGSQCFDFYYGKDQEDFVPAFKKALAQVDLMMMGRLTNRAKPHGFGRCPECETLLFSQRDRDERYLCQGCERRVTFTPAHSQFLDRLASDTLEASGIIPKMTSEGTLVIGLGRVDGEWPEKLSVRLMAAGYQPVPSDRAIYKYIEIEALKRNQALPKDWQVWLTEIASGQAAGEDGTPQALDRLLRDLRREFGAMWSMSATLPQGEFLSAMLGTTDEMFGAIRGFVDDHPGDLAIQRALVEHLVRVEKIAEARKAMLAMVLASPEDPDAIYAEATVAVAELRFTEAIPILETVLLAKPRDQMARMKLAYCYREIGDETRAAALWGELRAHGFGGGLHPA